MNEEKISLWQDPLHFIALGFGAGLSPKAPGTVGSLVGLLLWLLCPGGWIFHSLMIGVGFFLGVWICDVVGRDLGEADHSAIVWDEIVGIWIALLFVPHHSWLILAAFVLFRLFDITKPWPISWFDTQVKNGLGVMLDDVVAGVFALLVIQLWVYVT